MNIWECSRVYLLPSETHCWPSNGDGFLAPDHISHFRALWRHAPHSSSHSNLQASSLQGIQINDFSLKSQELSDCRAPIQVCEASNTDKLIALRSVYTLSHFLLYGKYGEKLCSSFYYQCMLSGDCSIRCLITGALFFFSVGWTRFLESEDKTASHRSCIWL